MRVLVGYDNIITSPMFVGADEEAPSNLDSGVPTVAVTDAAGTTLTAPTATLVGDGRYKSIDDGQTWQQQAVNACLSAAMLSAQIYLYVEDSNSVTISINGGITTVPMNIGTSQGYAWKVRGYIYP